MKCFGVTDIDSVMEDIRVHCLARDNYTAEVVAG